MPKFEKHIFICGNQRPAGAPRPCCDPAGQAELQKSFKEKLAARGLKGKVRANQSGCLDQCEHGPNLVVYPDAVWYGRVTLDDVDEIIESHIVGEGRSRDLRCPTPVSTPSKYASAEGCNQGLALHGEGIQRPWIGRRGRN